MSLHDSKERRVAACPCHAPAKAGEPEVMRDANAVRWSRRGVLRTSLTGTAAGVLASAGLGGLLLPTAGCAQKPPCPPNRRRMSVTDYLVWISEHNPGYVANWPLTRSVSLGSIGSLDETGFNQITTLRLQPQNSESAELSRAVNAEIFQGPKTTECQDPKTTEWTVSFPDSTGFVLQATGVNNTCAADLWSVREKVAQSIKDDGWSPDWYVVIGLQLGTVATLIVSDGDGSEMTLCGTTGTTLPFAGDASLKMTSSTGSMISYLTIKFPILMYRALKVKEAWFNSSNVASSAGVAPDHQGAFERRVAAATREGLPPMEELTVADVLRHLQPKT